MLRFLPLIIAAAVAVPLTMYEGYVSDRWNPVNTQAIQCAMLMDQVPMEIDGPNGLWTSYDVPVAEKIRDTAGAEGYIQRVYRNEKTGEIVSVWMIVGHYRDIVRHTPNICYRAQGFKQIDRDVAKFPLGPLPSEELTEEQVRMDGFNTTKFGKADVLGDWESVERVYWAWWMPETLAEGETLDPKAIRWVSPENPRLAFKYPRALYKLYFTVGSTPEGTAEETAALAFADLFIPIANEIIAKSGEVMDKPMEPEEVAARAATVKDQADAIKAKYEELRAQAAEAG